VTRARVVLAAIGLLVVWSLAVPTGAFSATSLDRGVDVRVAPDGEGYVGVTQACENDTLHVTVSNRFGSGRLLDVNVTVGGTTETADGLGVGDSETLTFGAVGPQTTVTITASGSGVTAHLNRSVPTDC
jgi:hypothetical protein